MSVRAGAGLAKDDAGVDSFAEAAARASLGLGGAPCGLALVVAGGPGASELEEGARMVRERLRPRAMIGCGAQGVLAAGREVEGGGVAVWAASLGDGHAEPFRLEASPAGSGIALSGVPNLDQADAVLLLVDPYGFPVEPLLGYLREARPGVPVLGGLASAGPGAALVRDEDVRPGGAVGAVLRGVRVVPCVSQGARPVGPEMAITAGEGNVIHELASRPALDRVRDAVAELHPAEQALAASGLLLGVVVDPNKPDYERGDFLIRGITGADEESGS
ncbi:MAG TPA: FIST N-terminal domain-containing protein, partial [Thermoleophilaceae bacterium]|nr:FIST N-terminal domain-containing protein [Thermoleophilaceae bacterium]